MKKANYLKKTMTASLTLMTGCILLSGFNVFAANSTFTSSTKNTAKIAIEDVDYDLKDKYEAIELDFRTNVQLKSSATVSVKDDSGNSYKSSIHEADHDDLSLDVTGLQAGKNYTVKIKGIKKSTASKYGSLIVKFSIPKASVAVKEIEYDAEDREVTFDFKNNVSYDNVKVIITNKNGTKTYSTKIVEKDSDDLTVSVKGLKYGSTYQYKITGVKNPNSSSTKTLTGTFTAVDHD